MAVMRAHLRFCIDVWTANGESILGHVAGIGDYELVHAVHGLAHEHVALLELNKSNRGSPWTAISRSNRRPRVLMVGRPSAPSLDPSTRLSPALRPRAVGSLSSS